MTAGDILAQIDRQYPNNVDSADKWGMIRQLEKLLLDECLKTHEISVWEENKAAEIAALDPMQADYIPLAQPPYHDLYIHYAAAMMAGLNADTDAYINESTLYNNALLTYKNMFNRTHRTKDSGQRWRF